MFLYSVSFCLPGTGCPKVINLTISGELVEGNVLSGVPEIAWCGGIPGKGVARFVYPIYSFFPRTRRIPYLLCIYLAKGTF
jgi:hypothetical protein